MSLPTLTLEEWKRNCERTSHLETGEKIDYIDSYIIEGGISAIIRAPHSLHPDQTVFIHIGSYFTKDSGRDVKAGTGWNHE